MSLGPYLDRVFLQGSGLRGPSATLRRQIPSLMPAAALGSSGNYYPSGILLWRWAAFTLGASSYAATWSISKTGLFGASDSSASSGGDTVETSGPADASTSFPSSWAGHRFDGTADFVGEDLNYKTYTRVQALTLADRHLQKFSAWVWDGSSETATTEFDSGLAFDYRLSIQGDTVMPAIATLSIEGGVSAPNWWAYAEQVDDEDQRLVYPRLLVSVSLGGDGANNLNDGVGYTTKGELILQVGGETIATVPLKSESSSPVTEVSFTVNATP